MIVDFHTHIFPPKVRERREDYVKRDLCFAEMYADPKAKMATAEELIAAMDEAGIDVSVALNIGWVSQDICRETNNYILESAAKHPKRIVPFIAVQPEAGDAAVGEVERCAGAGAKGIGEMRPDVQGFDLASHRVMSALVETLVRCGMIFLTHASEPVGHVYPGKGLVTPDKLYAFVSAFTELKVVCAHWGGGLASYALMPEVGKALTNVYFDSAATPYLYLPQVFRQTADLVGIEKVLFGTDYPLLSQRRVIADVDKAGLSETERRAVLGGNAARLLRMT
ncbi:MAG: amidohydrolase family protein [Chloroflexota bacterium]